MAAIEAPPDPAILTAAEPVGPGSQPGGFPASVVVSVTVPRALFCELAEWASQDGITIPELIEQFLREENRTRFFQDAGRAYRRLKGDAANWSAELADRAEWDGTLLDDLIADPESLADSVESEAALA